MNSSFHISSLYVILHPFPVDTYFSQRCVTVNIFFPNKLQATVSWKCIKTSLIHKHSQIVGKINGRGKYSGNTAHQAFTSHYWMLWCSNQYSCFILMRSSFESRRETTYSLRSVLWFSSVLWDKCWDSTFTCKFTSTI